jgi:hypothetical protein
MNWGVGITHDLTPPPRANDNPILNLLFPARSCRRPAPYLSLYFCLSSLTAPTSLRAASTSAGVFYGPDRI